MLFWASTILWIFLLQAVQTPTRQPNGENQSMPIDEVATTADELPARLTDAKKDWDVTRAYTDVFGILHSQNACSEFYGRPLTATTVLNSFVTGVKSQRLLREVSFQMTGRPRVIRDPETGVSYRLFERVTVNLNGSFYQRRTDPMRRFPSDVGSYSPGSRAARVLILLHELGHLIQGDNGDWLLPDDGFNGEKSRENTLRVQQVCRKELEALQ